MSDISTLWDVQNGRGDWFFSGADLTSGGDLESAVLISLFTDRLASADDFIPDGSGDRRGWCGDTGSQYLIGSRLWLLDRAKATQETLAAARDYMIEALQWLIDDGVVAKFDIYCEWTRLGMLGAQIVALKQDGTNIAMKFSWAWK